MNENMSREELLLQLQKANARIDTLKTRLSTVQHEKETLEKYLIGIKDACKTYFLSKTITKEEFYILYKRNVRGNLDIKV